MYGGLLIETFLCNAFLTHFFSFVLNILAKKSFLGGFSFI